MKGERPGPPERPTVSPVPRSSRDPFPVAAALDRGHSHETKGTVPLSHLRRWPVSQGQPQDSPRPFRGLLFGFLRGSLKTLSEAPQLLNVISRQNHIWPVGHEMTPEKRAIISAQSRFRLDADVGWMPTLTGRCNKGFATSPCPNFDQQRNLRLNCSAGESSKPSTCGYSRELPRETSIKSQVCRRKGTRSPFGSSSRGGYALLAHPVKNRSRLYNVYRVWLSGWHGAPWTPSAWASRPRREEQR